MMCRTITTGSACVISKSKLTVASLGAVRRPPARAGRRVSTREPAADGLVLQRAEREAEAARRGREPRGELIAYLRPDRTSARTSEFQWLPADDAAGVRTLLEQMIGVRACVRKRREVWLYENARIHLDTVDGLGRFVEIEVVVTQGMTQARAACEEVEGRAGNQRGRPDRWLLRRTHCDALAAVGLRFASLEASTIFLP